MDFDLNKRAQLSAMAATEGFKIFIEDIMEPEAKKFITALVNVPAGNDEAVLAAHKLAKAAAQYYQGCIDRLNAEVELYRQSPKATDKPQDVTDGNLDFGESITDEQAAAILDLMGEF